MPLTVGELLALIRVNDSDFNRGVDRAERKLVTSAGRMTVSTEKMRAVLARTAGLLLKGAGMAAFASLAAAATVNTLGMVASLGSLVGLLAAVPGLAIGAAGAFAALKIGLSGVADALKGDEEALAALAPQARAVVEETRALDGAWKRVRDTVQGAMFAPLRGQVTELARVWLPRLRIELGGIAAEFGLMAREAAVAARDPGFVSGIGAALLWLRQTLAANRGAVGDLVAAFGTLVGASAGVLGVSDGIAQAAASLREWASAVAESGQLAVWFETATATASQLGTVLMQVGGILGAVLGAAQAAGGGTLGVLGELLRGINAALSGAEGQAALVDIFGALQAVARPLVDILTTLLGALGPGVTALLGGLAAGLQALAPAAGPVGKAISAVAQALAPLLPLLGAVLADVLTVAAGMLQVLAAEFGPLIRVVADVGTTLARQLLPPLMQLIEAGLPLAVALGRALVDAFAPMAPVLVSLAQTFISEIMPALLQLQGELAERLLPVLAQVAGEVGGALAQALRDLAPHIPDLAKAVVAFAGAFVDLIIAGLPLLPLLTDLLTLVIGSGSLTAGIQILIFLLDSTAATLEMVSIALSATIGWLRSAWHWAQQAGSAIADAFTGALHVIGQLPGQIGGMFASAGSWLWDAGRRIVNGLIDGIRSAFGRVRDTLASLTDMLPDWKGPAEVDRRILAPSGRLLMSGLIDGIRAQVPALRAALGAVTVDLPAMVSPTAATAGGLDTAGVLATMAAAGRPQSTDADTIARAVRAALADMTVQLDGHAVGRVQAERADVMYRAEF